MDLISLAKSQFFGVSASIVVSISIWLLTATVAHCSTVGSVFQCERDSLAGYLIEFKAWPYQHVPFAGYWDYYDNKLAMLVSEPYSRLLLTVSMAYLIWFRIVIYAKNRQKRHARAEIADQPQKL